MEGQEIELRVESVLRGESFAGIPCMTQLQIKHSDSYSGEATDELDPTR
jgi:hypothetical protein